MRPNKRQKGNNNVAQRLASLRASYEQAKQDHVFKWVDQLNEEQTAELCDSLESVDPHRANRDFGQVQEAEKRIEADKIEFFTGEACISYDCSQAELDKYTSKGYEMIANGKVGLLLMAGGQGTRLGSDEPKGMFDIGLLSQKSLYQLQAEQIKKLQRLTATVTKTQQVNIPWYVITSETTRDVTVNYFEQNKYFGLNKENILFFEQGVNPCMSLDGKIMMQTKSKLAVAPNGNGGLHSAIRQSEGLAHMRRNGVEYLHCYGVDNVLVKLAEPCFVGYAALQNADCCNEVVLKEDPHEKVGVMCNRNGMPSVVEYSEISKQKAEMRDEAGNLLFSQGNIANHLFKVDFVDQVTSVAELPLHVAKKQIPHIDNEGNPTEDMGIKMEMFVFDVFMLTKSVVSFAVQRASHFTAVKNKAGERGKPFVTDSPDTARRDYSNYLISLVEAAGGTVIRSADPYDCFEISPEITYCGEGIEELVKGKTFKLPCAL